MLTPLAHALDPIVSALTLCISCHQSGPTITGFPFCSLCWSLLRRCPSLCHYCAGVGCPEGDCRFPWRKGDTTAIRSYSAQWTMDEGGGPLLRAWKKVGGSLLKSRLLKFEGSKFPSVDFVTWVPQTQSRIQRLGRSTSREVAESLANHLGLPSGPLLETCHNRGELRQAERRLRERLTDQPRFKVIGTPPKRVLLVDDFLTSGQTLRSAAQELSRWGAFEIHAFALGARLISGTREQTGLNGSLMESVGRSIAVSEKRDASELCQANRLGHRRIAG